MRPPKGFDMAPHKSFLVNDELADYLLAHAEPADDVQRRLQDDTAALGAWAGMQVSHEQAVFLGLLTRLIRPRLVVEVGVFTGYSSLAIARELEPGATLVACDVSEEWTARARQAWEEAGIADRVDLRIAPGLDTLTALDPAVPIDFAFIDADKVHYLAYYEAILERMRPGGLIAIDNALWDGRVINSTVDDADTMAIRALNDHVAADPRVRAVLLTVADGVYLAQKDGDT